MEEERNPLLLLIASERNRPLDYSGWIRARYVCGISMRVGATRVESRGSEETRARARVEGRRNVGSSEGRSSVPLRRARSDRRRARGILKN